MALAAAHRSVRVRGSFGLDALYIPSPNYGAFTQLTPSIIGDAHYVSPTGSASWAASTNINYPCSLATAADNVDPGDYVYLRGGTYVGEYTFSRSGTAGSRITFSGYAGEIATIDGEWTVPTNYYYFLVSVTGNYVTLKNTSIIRSRGALLVVNGIDSRAENIAGNGSYESGIIASSDGVILNGCTMTGNGVGYGIGGQPSWGSAIATVGAKTIIQGCVAYANLGEGLNAYSSASNSIIQDCISYDNKSLGLYLDSTQGAIIRRNLVYYSPGYSESNARGITIGYETGTPGNLQIYNNLIMGAFTNFEIDGNATSLANTTIAYNTFVNGRGDVPNGYNMGVYFRDVAFNNVIFKNNIVVEEASDKVPIYVPSSHPGLTLSYNCWNKTPSAAAQGAGDVVGDPLLAKTGPYGAGTLLAAWFKILSGSPAKNAGNAIVGIDTDFWNTLRPQGSDPDMGAHEYI